MSLSSRQKVSVQFSMSGMSDIIFLLLIFFIVTSTLIVPNALRLQLPESNNRTTTKAQTTVSITKDLRFYVNKVQVSESEIESRLVKELRYKPDPSIALFVERSVPIEEVVKIMNIARRNNYKTILATSPEK